MNPDPNPVHQQNFMRIYKKNAKLATRFCIVPLYVYVYVTSELHTNTLADNIT